MATSEFCQQRNSAASKQVITAIVCLITLLSNTLYASDNDLPDHIGRISAAELLAGYPEFASEYANYQPTASELTKIEVLAGKNVTVLFGTWCHDSEREVPRLLKLLDEAQVNLGELTLYGVSRKKDDPDGYSEKYELRYTPTLLVHDQGTEIARIIERPKENLSADFAKQILAAQKQ